MTVMNGIVLHFKLDPQHNQKMKSSSHGNPNPISCQYNIHQGPNHTYTFHMVVNYVTKRSLYHTTGLVVNYNCDEDAIVYHQDRHIYINTVCLYTNDINHIQVFAKGKLRRCLPCNLHKNDRKLHHEIQYYSIYILLCNQHEIVKHKI